MISKSVHRYNKKDSKPQNHNSAHLKCRPNNDSRQGLSKSSQFQQLPNRDCHRFSVQIPRKKYNRDIFFYKRPWHLKGAQRNQIQPNDRYKREEYKNSMAKFRSNLDKLKIKHVDHRNITNTNRYQRFMTEHSKQDRKVSFNLSFIKNGQKIKTGHKPIQVFQQFGVLQNMREKLYRESQQPISNKQEGMRKKFSLPINLQNQKNFKVSLAKNQQTSSSNFCLSGQQKEFIQQKIRLIQQLNLINLYSTDCMKESNIILKNHIDKTTYPSRNKIINIPDQKNMHRFLELYEPICKKLNAKKLKLSPLFQIKQITDQLQKRVYFGEIIEQKFNGQGILISPYEIKQGEWKNGNLISGILKNQFQIYEGQFENNAKNGNGESNFQDGSYFHGCWVQNLRHGKGYLTFHNGISYFGDWAQGNFSGQGILQTLNSVYEGQFLQSMRCGFGRQQFQNGDSYEGSFEFDLPSKQGKYFWSQGSRFIGEFNLGKLQGKGKFICPDVLVFSGIFKNDKPHGIGRIYFNNGDQYNGYFQQGKLCGYGNLTSKAQRKIFSGIWFNNELLSYKQI